MQFLVTYNTTVPSLSGATKRFTNTVKGGGYQQAHDLARMIGDMPFVGLVQVHPEDENALLVSAR